MNYAKYDLHGEAVTKDGHTMFKQDIVKDLNRKSFLEGRIEQQQSQIEALHLKVSEQSLHMSDLGAHITGCCAMCNYLQRSDCYDKRATLQRKIEKLNKVVEAAKEIAQWEGEDTGSFDNDSYTDFVIDMKNLVSALAELEPPEATK